MTVQNPSSGGVSVIHWTLSTRQQAESSIYCNDTSFLWVVEHKVGKWHKKTLGDNFLLYHRGNLVTTKLLIPQFARLIVRSLCSIIQKKASCKRHYDRIEKSFVPCFMKNWSIEWGVLGLWDNLDLHLCCQCMLVACWSNYKTNICEEKKGPNWHLVKHYHIG